MALRRIGDTPLFEPVLAQYTDAYMRHSGKISETLQSVLFWVFSGTSWVLWWMCECFKLEESTMCYVDTMSLEWKKQFTTA